MKTLFIDTHNSRKFSVAIKDHGQLQIADGIDASTELLSKVEQLNANDIKKIIFIKGPGSLTGLRIGASFALGLGLGWNVPIQTISIWDLIFAKYPTAEVFFYTGTKKWIHKTAEAEKLVEFHEIVSSNPCCITNNPEKFPAMTPTIQYPNIIELMSEFEHLATDNLDLIYNVNLF